MAKRHQETRDERTRRILEEARRGNRATVDRIDQPSEILTEKEEKPLPWYRRAGLSSRPVRQSDEWD